jgi:mRNA interferase MazF
MALNKGDVLLAQFPFTDLSQNKLRPAIVLHTSVRKNEVTICFISSQNVMQLSDTEFSVLDTDPEFSITGLRTNSKVRVSRIVTLNHQLTSRKLGRLGTYHMKILDSTLKNAFNLSGS